MILVLLDVDGTLVDSMAMEAACFVDAFSAQTGVFAIDTDWSTYPHATDPGIAITLYQRHFGRSPTDEELAGLERRFLGSLQDTIAGTGCRAVPGALELVITLRGDRRFRPVVATGGWRRPILAKLAAAGIDVTGLPFASADDAIARSDIFGLAMARAGGSDRAVLIGDGVWDVVTARQLGTGFLGVGTADRAARLVAAGAHRVVADYTDLPAVLAILAEQGPL